MDHFRRGCLPGHDRCSRLYWMWFCQRLWGQGKIKALNLINKSHEYRQLFTSFGQEWHATENVFQRLQAFACNMYCSNTYTKLVNKLRGMKCFVLRWWHIFGTAPTMQWCTKSLRQHTHRANYQAAIWRRSLESSPTVPSPTDGHGWNLLHGQLELCWLTGALAPEVVLELMSCRCSRNCDKDGPCVMNGLRCTPACKLQVCTNMQNDDDDDDGSSDLDESDSDEE